MRSSILIPRNSSVRPLHRAKEPYIVCSTRKNAITVNTQTQPLLLTLSTLIACSARPEVLVEVLQHQRPKPHALLATGAMLRMSRQEQFQSIPAQQDTKIQVQQALQGPQWLPRAQFVQLVISARAQILPRLHVWQVTSAQKAPSLRHNSPVLLQQSAPQDRAPKPVAQRVQLANSVLWAQVFPGLVHQALPATIFSSTDLVIFAQLANTSCLALAALTAPRITIVLQVLPIH